jgi:hypothetical protein
MFNPFNWYWLADDTRVYASGRQLTINSADPEYVEWATSMQPSEWPRDEVGNQTAAVMQEVMSQYGLTVDLYYYAAKVRGEKENTGISAQGVLLPSDVATQAQVSAAYTQSLDDAAATYSGRLADGSFVLMSGAQLATYNAALTTYHQACINCESDTADAIDLGTITTREQVDAAFAAISNAFTSSAFVVKRRRAR